MHHVFALLAQQAKDQQGFDPSMLLLMGAIFAAFYFLIIMPMKRREKKDRESLFTKLKKNDKVLTTSGIIGIVAAIEDDEVTLKVDESSNVRLRVLKSTIHSIRNPKEAPKDSPAKDAQSSENVKAGSPPAGK